MATFMLGKLDGWTLPKAVNTVTRNPARAIRLEDRGDVAAGQRADVLRVRMNGAGMPRVVETWRAGHRAF